VVILNAETADTGEIQCRLYFRVRKTMTGFFDRYIFLFWSLLAFLHRLEDQNPGLVGLGG
jgi:hypothetical protein